MTVIGSNPIGSALPVSTNSPFSSIVRALHKTDAAINGLLDRMMSGLMQCLCRASRGYLCPPDMASIMYPEDSPAPVITKRGCCDEKLSGN